MTTSGEPRNQSDPWYLRVLPHWPTTWPGAISMIALLVFAAALIYWIAHDPRSKIVVALFDKTGAQEVKLEHVLVFTTPSYLTKYDLTADQAGDVNRHQQFAKLKKDAPYYFVDDPPAGVTTCSALRNITECLGPEVLEFKNALDTYKSRQAKQIQGYEMYESYGTGSGPLKRGLTWKVTVPEKSDFNRDDIVRLYVQYWHRITGIYIEDLGVPKTRD